MQKQREIQRHKKTSSWKERHLPALYGDAAAREDGSTISRQPGVEMASAKSWTNSQVAIIRVAETGSLKKLQQTRSKSPKREPSLESFTFCTKRKGGIPVACTWNAKFPPPSPCAETQDSKSENGSKKKSKKMLVAERRARMEQTLNDWQSRKVQEWRKREEMETKALMDKLRQQSRKRRVEKLASMYNSNNSSSLKPEKGSLILCADEEQEMKGTPRKRRPGAVENPRASKTEKENNDPSESWYAQLLGRLKAYDGGSPLIAAASAK